jgi:hypothetical protein
MLNRLLCILFGIIIYILYNIVDTFTIGIPFWSNWRIFQCAAPIVELPPRDDTEDGLPYIDDGLESSVCVEQDPEQSIEVGGGASGDTSDAVCIDLPLSIQMHEFALFVHYQERLKYLPPEIASNFFLYIGQPEYHMRRILAANYDSSQLLRIPRKSPNDPITPEYKDIAAQLNIVAPNYKIFPVLMQIPFQYILSRYNGMIPEIYRYEIIGNSYFNRYGFQLLKRDDHLDDINNFYDVVREYFCSRSLEYEGDIDDLIELILQFFQEKTLEELTSTSQDIYDPWSELGRRLKQYINYCAKHIIGYVLNCPSNPIISEQYSKYIIVKLKEGTTEFTYDNTEMVVHTCNLLIGETDPGPQYHIGILRNPSDFMIKIFRKKFPEEIVEKIITFNNNENRILNYGRLF